MSSDRKFNSPSPIPGADGYNETEGSGKRETLQTRKSQKSTKGARAATPGRSRSLAAPIKGHITHTSNNATRYSDQANERKLKHLGGNPETTLPINDGVLKSAENFQKKAMFESPNKNTYYREGTAVLEADQPTKLAETTKRKIVMLKRELKDKGCPTSPFIPDRNVVTVYETASGKSSAETGNESIINAIDEASVRLHNHEGSDQIRIDNPTNDSSNLQYHNPPTKVAESPKLDKELGSTSSKSSLHAELAAIKQSNEKLSARVKILENDAVSRFILDEQQRESEELKLQEWRALKQEIQCLMKFIIFNESSPQIQTPAQSIIQSISGPSQASARMTQNIKYNKNNYEDSRPTEVPTNEPSHALQLITAAQKEAQRQLDQMAQNQLQSQADLEYMADFIAQLRQEILNAYLERKSNSSEYEKAHERDEQPGSGKSTPSLAPPLNLNANFVGDVINFETNSKNLASFDGTGNFRAFRNGFDTIVLNDKRLPKINENNILQNQLIGNARKRYNADMNTYVLRCIESHNDSRVETSSMCSQVHPSQNEITLGFQSTASNNHVSNVILAENQSTNDNSRLKNETKQTGKPKKHPLAYDSRKLPSSYVDPITGIKLEGYYMPENSGPDLKVIHRTFPIADETSAKPCPACNGNYNSLRCNLSSMEFRRAVEQKGLCPICCSNHPIQQCESPFRCAYCIGVHNTGGCPRKEHFRDRANYPEGAKRIIQFFRDLRTGSKHNNRANSSH